MLISLKILNKDVLEISNKNKHGVSIKNFLQLLVAVQSYKLHKFMNY
jgi:hypothetical protein